ncbi:MAG: hypothetical protein ACXW3D_04955 [Caulobacteraceae bacterium]
MKRSILAASAAILLSLGLTACGDRGNSQEAGSLSAEAPSDMVADVAPASEAAAVEAAATNAAATVPAPADTGDYSADDMAATGDTSRRSSGADTAPVSQ